MHQNRVISRDLGTPPARKSVKVKGTGAATKGLMYHAYANQVSDDAQRPPKDYVSTSKKV
tara:strand:- start:958 stop:1137 length:180 start_codon:yes stop_codon:yes gene_type:complete